MIYTDQHHDSQSRSDIEDLKRRHAEWIKDWAERAGLTYLDAAEDDHKWQQQQGAEYIRSGENYQQRALDAAEEYGGYELPEDDRPYDMDKLKSETDFAHGLDNPDDGYMDMQTVHDMQVKHYKKQQKKRIKLAAKRNVKKMVRGVMKTLEKLRSKENREQYLY